MLKNVDFHFDNNTSRDQLFVSIDNRMNEKPKTNILDKIRLTDNILIQTGVFVIVSAILIPITKPFVDKYLVRKTIPTNTYSVLNKIGIVTKEITSPDGVGLVKIDGEVWSAKSDNDTQINKGTEVKVLKIDGVKLIVTPK